MVIHNDELTELRRAIAEAFAAVTYPGDDELIRCPYDCAECRRIAGYFKGKNWLGHDAAEWRERHLALTLFTPKAFQYFLPGFMLASLASRDRDEILPDAIRFHFEYVLEFRKYFDVRMAAFSPAQRRVVVDYFTWMENLGIGALEDMSGSLRKEFKHA